MIVTCKGAHMNLSLVQTRKERKSPWHDAEKGKVGMVAVNYPMRMAKRVSGFC